MPRAPPARPTSSPQTVQGLDHCWFLLTSPAAPVNTVRHALLAEPVGSPSVATTTPSSGRARSGPRTSRSCARPASPSSPSASSPGRCSSPSRASSTSTGSTASWTCCTTTASRSTWPPRPPPRRRGCRPRTPRCCPSTATGHTLWPGSRQAYCPSSPVYRERALALVEQLATALPRPPGAGDVARRRTSTPATTCPATATSAPAASAAGCERRYGDLDTLNEAWGTAFWSQRYTDWDQVLPPRLTTTFANPTQRPGLPPVLLRRAAGPLTAARGDPARTCPPASR